MESLFHKYQAGRLTEADLQQLRHMIDTMTDEEIARAITAGNSEGSPVEISQEVLDNIKMMIDRKLGVKTPQVRIYKWICTVAAMMIGLLVCAGVYLYKDSVELKKYQGLLDTDICVSTKRGESANASLPDGTRVALSYESSLSYSLKDFNEVSRSVKFDGSASFYVTKLVGTPFLITTNNIEIKVLGTIFNLSARSDDTYAELYLDEGCVQLSSLLSNEMITMKPHDFAVVDYASGSIEVRSVTNISEANARMRGDMAFDGTPLYIVLEKLSRRYDRKFIMDKPELMADEQFTGYLPSDNLAEALNILARSFHLATSAEGNEVTLSH